MRLWNDAGTRFFRRKKWRVKELNGLLGFVFVHAFFNLFLHVRFGIVEFTDAPSQSPHEFGDLAAAKKDENGQDDQDPFGTYRHGNEQLTDG